jgi:hypothetical protein
MAMKFRFFILAIVFLTSCFLFNCQKGLDVKAAEAVSNPVSNPSFEIDASKKGSPISKYIYGQFIEWAAGTSGADLIV